MRSMTGYGRGRAENKVAAVDVELRSVNGKGLNFKLRLPGDRLENETALEAALRRRLSRGSVQGNVRVRLLEARTAVPDAGALRRYLREWRAAEKELGLEVRDPSLGELLALPGAFETPDEDEKVGRSVARCMEQGLDQALDALIESREKEGVRLAKELLALIARMERELARIRKELPKVLAALKKRLLERAQEALRDAGVEVVPELGGELAGLAERGDVREEVARLEIHFERLRKLLDQGGVCGREVDFLAQECHREVTTLGNKVTAPRIGQGVIAMKVLIQQFKEQTANVE